MAHAYTPGLRVTQQATIRKERMLPIAGEVLVVVGAKVQASDVIARAELPGDVATVNVVKQLGIGAGDLERFMLKKVGEAVTKDEPIAQNRPLIKWFRRVVRAPVSGSIETVSSVTGQVLLRTPPRPVEVRAYVDGVVVEVRPGEGAVIARDEAVAIRDAASFLAAHARLAAAGRDLAFALFERAVWRGGGDRTLTALRETECDLRSRARFLTTCLTCDAKGVAA